MTLETGLMIYVTGALAGMLWGFMITEFKADIIKYQIIAISVMAVGWPIIVLSMLLPHRRKHQ